MDLIILDLFMIIGISSFRAFSNENKIEEMVAKLGEERAKRNIKIGKIAGLIMILCVITMIITSIVGVITK